MSSSAEAAPAAAALWRPKADPPANPCCTFRKHSEDPIAAAASAKEVFPGNAPGYGSMDGVVAPQHIAAMTTKYWGPSARVLSVSFLEAGVPQDLKERILSHMNAWGPCAVKFSLADEGQVGNVRITLEKDPIYGGGYWSLLGTDINNHPKNRATMCLQGFSMATPESEFIRVVRHETGHTLGFPHEHMRADVVAGIDPEAAYVHFMATDNWSKEEVDAQVLTPLKTKGLMLGTPTADTLSIMCYQIPKEVMKDGKPVLGGTDIDAKDRAFCYEIYPWTAARTYVVKEGDTVWTLAMQLGIDLPTFTRLNPTITNPDMIVPGKVLNLP